MIKDVQKYMTDSEDDFASFLAAIDELIGSQYILAESKISVLLQRIAASRRTYSLFERALSGFDFNYEFSLAKRRTAAGGETIALPPSRKRTVALVFCLLLDFDTGRFRLRDFLHIYFFSNNNPNWEFAAFVKDVLMPFREAAESLYFGGEEEDEPEDGEDMYDGDESLSELETLFTDFGTLSDKIIDSELTDDEYDETEFALGVLSRALTGADREGIRLAYMALKSTAAKIPALDSLRGDIAAFGEKLVRLGAIPFV